MLNRKLLEFLSRLSKQEHRQLRLFIQSPYFNQHVRRNADELLQLYDYIMRYDADEQRPALNKEKVSRRFYPDFEYKENAKGPVDALTSDLLILVKHFLTQSGYQQNTLKAPEDLLSQMRFYRKFGMEERFQRCADQLKQAIDEYPFRDETYYTLQLKTAHELLYFGTLLTPHQIEEESFNVHYNLDMLYALQKMDYLSALRMQNNIFVKDPRFKITQELNNAVIEFAQSSATAENPIFRLYDLVMKLNEHSGDIVLLQTFEQELDMHQASVPLKIKIALCTHLRNMYAWHYSRTGDPAMQQKLFALLKVHLENGLLDYEGSLHVANLSMLIVHALKQQQFDWVRRVLEQYPPERLCGTRYPAEASSLNWADYYFHLGDYDKAADLLTYKPFEHPILMLIAESLLIKIYYESNSSLLETRLRALDQKVRRSKLGQETKQRYFNFVRMLEKMERRRWLNDEEKIQALLDEIKSTPNMPYRDWLIEKASLIQNPNKL